MKEETVFSGNGIDCYKMKVDGGFIYRYTEYIPTENEWRTTSSVFVPKATSDSKIEKQLEWLWEHCTIKYHSEDSVSPIEHTPGKNEYAKNLIEHEMMKAR
jgi:hypothetical protein